MSRWWWDRSEQIEEDEQAVADLRMKMERIMAQLEKTIEEMREALDGNHEEGPDGPDGPGRGSNGGPEGPEGGLGSPDNGNHGIDGER